MEKVKSKYNIFDNKPERTTVKIGKKTKKVLIFCLIFILFALGAAYFAREFYKGNRNEDETISLTGKPSERTETSKPKEAEELTIPTEKVIAMPYTVQAPLAKWDVHDESCEEAALLMYHYFLEGQNTFSGNTAIPPQTAHDEEIKMKNWQVQNYGKEPDLTISALGKFAKEYYGYNFQTFENISKEDIKREIAKGNPVIVPVITHALGNPHYGAEPSYHVVVIKGYNADGVITNDPGVKQGENYFYTWDIIFKAIDAQTPKMSQGRVMSVLKI